MKTGVNKNQKYSKYFRTCSASHAVSFSLQLFFFSLCRALTLNIRPPDTTAMLLTSSSLYASEGFHQCETNLFYHSPTLKSL